MLVDKTHVTADISRDLLGSGIFTPVRRISSRVRRKTTAKWAVASRAPSTCEKAGVQGKGSLWGGRCLWDRRPAQAHPRGLAVTSGFHPFSQCSRS